MAKTTIKDVETLKVRSADSMIDALRNGKEITDIKNDKEQKNLEFAQLVIKSENFVKSFIEKNGTKAFISERLRSGYIGEIVHADNGASYIQSVRGKPFGTVVAVKTDKNVVLGMSYMDPEDANKGHPIVGLYIALKRAIDGLESGKVKAEERYIKSRARKQIQHFEKRALAYFHPDTYSYSRGTNPVKYEDYEEIHKRRAMILGEDK